MRLEDGKTQLMILAGYVEVDAQGLIYHVNPDEIVNKLASGADVNLQCSAGKTALMYAAIASNAMAVKVLLEHGANPDIVDAEGKTAMFHQLENVLSEPVRFVICQELMTHGANLNLRDAEEGATVLMKTVQPLHGGAPAQDLLEPLLLGRAHPDIQDNEGWTPLMACCAESSGLEQTVAIQMIDTLLQHGADVNVINLEGRNALSLAAEGSYEIATALLKPEYLAKYTPSALSACDRTARGPVHYAVIASQQGLTNQLMNAKADINTTTSTFVLGQSNLGDFGRLKIDDIDALKYSALEHNDDMQEIERVTRLIQAGMDPNSQTQGQKLTALMFAAARDRQKLCNVLVEHKADLDIQGGDMQLTALMFAASTGGERCVQILLDAKADTTMVDQRGFSALDWANKNGHKDIAALIASNDHCIPGDRGTCTSAFGAAPHGCLHTIGCGCQDCMQNGGYYGGGRLGADSSCYQRHCLSDDTSRTTVVPTKIRRGKTRTRVSNNTVTISRENCEMCALQ